MENKKGLYISKINRWEFRIMVQRLEEMEVRVSMMDFRTKGMTIVPGWVLDICDGAFAYLAKTPDDIRGTNTLLFPFCTASKGIVNIVGHVNGTGLDIFDNQAMLNMLPTKYELNREEVKRMLGMGIWYENNIAALYEMQQSLRTPQSLPSSLDGPYS